MYMNKPNLFIIGAPKCATTSMYHYLKNHNDVFVPEIKEQHFFSLPMVKDTYYDVYFAKNENDYLRNYDDAKNKKIIADISPSYLYYKESADKIMKFNTKSKIIVILRDPIERAISHYLMDLRIGYVNKPFFHYLKDKNTLYYKEYVGNSLYYETVKYYKELFKDNLLVISFKELKNNPELIMNDVFDFLDIERIKINFSTKYNFYSRAKSPIIYYLRKLHLFNFIYKYIPENLKCKIKTLLFNTVEEKPSFNEEKDFLQKIFEEDSKKLEKLLNKKLW